MQQLSKNLCFGGEQLKFSHHSSELNCEMTFSLYLPPQAKHKPVPLIYWLSGLTCTDDNFVQKAGAQRYAAEAGIAIICPDTSPRGEGIPDDPEGAYDFGLGAGFYVDATQKPWSANYRMYSYILAELPQCLIDSKLPLLADRTSIMGHSMGGHGALTIAMKNPGRFRSVSAFAPICSPVNCPWGQKALSRYLGENKDSWLDYDSCALLEQCSEKLPLLVDQGEADNFLNEQLKPDLLEQACARNKHPLILRRHPGYDHSYFFIASFIEDHIRHHSSYLLN